MLNKLKLLLGIDSTAKDGLLLLLISKATEFVKSYTHNNNLSELENVILQIAVYDYNRLGSEGADSENYSGVSISYSSDYPQNLYKQMQAYRKVRMI